MDTLTPAEKASLIRCIQDDLPLPMEYLSRLLPKEAKPQLVWPGKDPGCSISDIEIKLCEVFAPVVQPAKARDEADWQDKLMLGDNLQIMAALATGKLAEEIKSRWTETDIY